MQLNRPPVVLFVCVRNAGKSQLAAALLRQRAGNRIEVYSAGTHPAAALSADAVASLAEVGASVDGEHCKPVDRELFARADRVVLLGDEVQLEPVPGMRGIIERWVIDEPARRGVEGAQRMRLVRDDIADRVRRLEARLVGD